MGKGSGLQAADVRSSEKAAELILALLVRLGQPLRSLLPRGPLLPVAACGSARISEAPSSGTAACLPLP